MNRNDDMGIRQTKTEHQHPMAENMKKRCWQRPVAIVLALTLVLCAIGITLCLRTRISDEPADSALANNAQMSIVKRRNLNESTNSNCQVSYKGQGTLISQTQGVLTALPMAGETIHNGERLYSVSNEPVSLLHGALPAWRGLEPGTSDGPDIAQLKNALVALGYSSQASMGTSESWTSRLTQAVKKFQNDRGQPKTGVLPLGSVVFVLHDIRIAKVSVPIGSALQENEKVIEYVGTERTLSCEMESSQRRFAEIGAEASVRFGDGTLVSGTVSGVEAITAESEEDNDEKLKISLAANTEELTALVDGATGQATFSRLLKENVLAVPVSALTALPEHGFAVQREGKNSGLSYVHIEVGIFSDTWVEVVSGNLSEGDSIAVAS